MDDVRAAIERVLAAHEPYPAVVIDRWGTSWPPTAASRSRNLEQWRGHLLHRLQLAEAPLGAGGDHAEVHGSARRL